MTTKHVRRPAILPLAAIAATAWPGGLLAAQHGDPHGGGRRAPAEPFAAEHVELRHSLLLQGTPEQVFPLFELQRRWGPAVFLHPRTGPLQRGSVLVVDPESRYASIWVVADYDRSAGRARYVSFVTDHIVTEWDIRLASEGNRATRATVTLRATALSPAVNPAVRAERAEFPEMMDGWEARINEELARGAPMPTGRSATFEPVYVERARQIRLDAPASRAFTMFEPKDMRRWGTHTLDRQFLFPASGEARTGAVMRVTHPRHEEGQAWVVADYDPDATHIRYVIHLPDAEAWELEIACTDDGDGGTLATVTYRVTSLSPEMNDAVRRFFDEEFDSAIDGWQTQINRALREERR